MLSSLFAIFSIKNKVLMMPSAHICDCANRPEIGFICLCMFLVKNKK
jgi:hypothetical protein